MRVAVIGTAGFVGPAIVRRLVAERARVVAVVRPGGDLRSIAPGVEVLPLELEDVEESARAIAASGPDACIHLADAGERNAERLLRVNALGAHALARELAEAGCARLVTCGSSSDHGHLHAATGLAGGLLARAAGLELGLETVHLSLSSVYGPGEDEGRLIGSVARALVECRPVDLPSGDEPRDFVYIDDVVEALVTAAVAPGVGGEVLAVGSGRRTTVREACLALAAAAGADPALLRFGAQPARAGGRVSVPAQAEHTERLLGWRARTSLDEGLALTVAHLRGGFLRAAA